MTTIDNSKIFLGGSFCDVTVKVPASTTYAQGLVLGRKSDGDLVAYSTDNDTALDVDFTAESATEAFVSEPTYILAQTLVNTAKTATEFALARVFECGPVNKDKLVFAKTADATNPVVLDKLKNNGFKLELVQEYT